MTLWQLLLQSLARWLVRLAWLAFLLPLALVGATPFIVLRAAFLVRRRRQKFRFALADGYAAVWEFCVGVMLWPAASV